MMADMLSGRDKDEVLCGICGLRIFSPENFSIDTSEIRSHFVWSTICVYVFTIPHIVCRFSRVY